MEESGRRHLVSLHTERMLMDATELSILRALRTHDTSELNRDAVQRIVTFFEDALTGDQAVSGGQMTAATDSTLGVVRLASAALAQEARTAERFRRDIKSLKSIADTLLRGELPPDDQLERLRRFIHQISLLLSDQLSQVHRTSSTGGEIWQLPPLASSS